MLCFVEVIRNTKHLLCFKQCYILTPHYRSQSRFTSFRTCDLRCVFTPDIASGVCNLINLKSADKAAVVSV